MDGILLDLSHIDPFQKWSIICAVALTIIYAVMRPLKKKKEPLARPTQLSLAGQREVEKQMTELLVELEKMARQMTAQLDSRAVRLEVLIKEADEKIAALKTAGQSTTTQIAPRKEASSSLIRDPAPDPRHAQAYELADKGLDGRQIARQLGRPVGEVELILALRDREKAEAV